MGKRLISKNEIIKQAKDKKESLIFPYLKTTTLKTANWQEVGIYFTNAGKNGRKPKHAGKNFV